jgi:putative membrane protein
VSSAPSVPDLLTRWTPDAALVLALVVAAVSYGCGVRSARSWPARRSLAFAGGLTALAVALMSGVDLWADRLLSLHMTQHVLLTMVAAPLLVAGAPERLALLALPRGGRAHVAAALRSRVARVLTRPAVAWCALPVAMAALHAPAALEVALAHAPLHHLDHLLLVGAALLFWTPVLAGELNPRRLTALGRLGYLLAAMGPMGAVGAVLTSAAPLYPPYVAAAPAVGVSAAGDQHLAGAVMWIGGGYALVVATVWSVWALLMQEERRARSREAYEDARVVA